MTDTDELFWNDLLLAIEKGKVIPVLGPDLLTVHIDGADLPLYVWLAQQLAVRNKIAPADLPPDFCLNDVVAHHVKKGGERNALYSQINHCLADARLAPDVAALHGLATILPLNLFVTLSFDSLLAQAITKVRAAAPQQYAYAPNDIGDLPTRRQALKPPEGAATVFHLFGIASSPPDFVICDDDKLEFVRALQEKRLQPTRLFAELRTKHLLILGCGFADWLARFFLRTARSMKFADRRERSDYLLEHDGRRDQDLVLFLESFSKETKPLSMTAHDFVLELARRWHEKHPPVLVAASAATAARVSTSAPGADAWEAGTEPPQDGAVFISYATEDFEIARTLVEGLRAAGVDCWFDRNNLEPGAAWANAIARGIGRCALFLPIISKITAHSDNRERYFWREWNIADQRARGMGPDLEFVVPVMVDETRIDKLPIQMHDTFTSKQGVGLPGGKVTDAFAKRILHLQREFRRRQR
jgi:TIR domain/SIR2-like domain